MLEFGPASPEIVAHYRERQTEFTRLADALRIARLPDPDFRELADLLGSDDSARLVEAVARLHDYSNKRDHAQLRKDVSQLLKKRGTRLPRGKRTKPEMEALVSEMAPLLLNLGIKLASSERSHLVRALRLLAGTFEIDGDPRDELRRVIAKASALEKSQKEHMDEIIRRVWRGLFPG